LLVFALLLKMKPVIPSLPLLLLLAVTPVWSLDEAAAEALARKSGCLKCHGIEKKKDGPALKEVAAKYKGKADAVAKLNTHLTTSPKVKIEGKEEEHEQLKTKDAAEIKNVIAWVLSR
jgi:cytochrome c